MTTTVTDDASAAVEPLPSGRTDRALIAALRMGIAMLWIQNTGWKRPPDFGQNSGRGLYMWTKFAVDREVFAPYAWFVEHVVLPNFTFFGWLTLLVEASLGAFLLVGLATRLWAAIGVVQSLAIMLSVLKAPHEWHWSYFLMILAHLVIFATAAGRTAGLDGVLRPRWRRSNSMAARLLMRAS